MRVVRKRMLFGLEWSLATRYQISRWFVVKQTYYRACTISVANWSARHGSPNDEGALVIAQISTRSRLGEEGEDIGYGYKLGLAFFWEFLFIVYVCICARDKRKEDGITRRETRVTADLWNFSVTGNHTLKCLFTGRRCAIFFATQRATTNYFS